MSEHCHDEHCERDWKDRRYRKMTIWATCSRQLEPDDIMDALNHLDHGWVALLEPGSAELSQAELMAAESRPVLNSCLCLHECDSEVITVVHSPTEVK